MEHQPQANRLLQESSPYLLQHAYNPVDWYPWGPEALQRAKAEDKPILLSIGYAACHWCHVMEHESFEHPQIAAVMNEHFVCIKVDREERPDVDQLYMDAVQAMGVPGGWPLHVFLMPDQKPFYGGTYFPPKNWHQLLLSVADAYSSHKEELSRSAEQFTQVLKAPESSKYRFGDEAAAAAQPEELTQLYHHLSQRFDRQRGGLGNAPKFPMPAIYRLLLRYHHFRQHQPILDQVTLTLDQMARGGIYDQLGGGFARYSVDQNWIVPHFEKMLYDNGQLISLYAEAYQVTKRAQYRQVVKETVAFVLRELCSPEGGFYSSLDADSEGEEGRFYLWKQEELQQALQQAGLAADVPLLLAYYSVTAEGNWEEAESNILYRSESDEDFAARHQLRPEELQAKVRQWQQVLLPEREKRIRPGLDDKILAGWNALLLTGLTDAYRAFGEAPYLEAALRNGRFLKNRLKQGRQLFRSYKNGRATIPAFLEDYALVIQAFTALYEVTFEEEWLQHATELTEQVLEQFYDPTEGLFYFTSHDSEALVARKKELFDNVIPASNSAMALNLHHLGLLLARQEWLTLAGHMLGKVKELLLKEPGHLANWGILLSLKLNPGAEVALIGPEVQQWRQELQQHFLPQAVFTGTAAASQLPLLRNRSAVNSQTTVYVCENQTCRLPVHSAAEALAQLRSKPENGLPAL